jgi:hypothetical protein
MSAVGAGRRAGVGSAAATCNALAAKSDSKTPARETIAKLIRFFEYMVADLPFTAQLIHATSALNPVRQPAVSIGSEGDANRRRATRRDMERIRSFAAGGWAGGPTVQAVSAIAVFSVDCPKNARAETMRFGGC